MRLRMPRLPFSSISRSHILIQRFVRPPNPSIFLRRWIRLTARTSTGCLTIHGRQNLVVFAASDCTTPPFAKAVFRTNAEVWMTWTNWARARSRLTDPHPSCAARWVCQDGRDQKRSLVETGATHSNPQSGLHRIFQKELVTNPERTGSIWVLKLDGKFS
jgi:hypothetical protein